MTGRGRLAVALASLGAVLVLAAALVLPRFLDDDTGDARAGDPAQDASQGTTGLDGAVETDYEGGHTVEEVEYAETPPMGGVHDPAWLQCGIYDRPVREENAVHSLEHGTVWITYEPDLAEDDVQALAELLPARGILSPHDDLPSPVVVTVWNRQLAVTGPDDPGLQAFIDEYGDGGTAPEPLASCEGGVVALEE